ncbi:MAG: hypothetical protein ACK4SY_07005 [Pyrobaculum sp.]
MSLAEADLLKRVIRQLSGDVEKDVSKIKSALTKAGYRVTDVKTEDRYVEVEFTDDPKVYRVWLYKLSLDFDFGKATLTKHITERSKDGKFKNLTETVAIPLDLRQKEKRRRRQRV